MSDPPANENPGEIDPELLDILVCPESKQPVRLAGADLLARLNEGVAGGTLVSRGGVAVSEPLDGGLVREDGSVIYPIREGIPIMLIDESIALPEPG